MLTHQEILDVEGDTISSDHKCWLRHPEMKKQLAWGDYLSVFKLKSVEDVMFHILWSIF
jgi:hypothetical protein